MPSKSKKLKPNRHFNLFWQYPSQTPDTTANKCPYCQSREVVKRGRRHNKHQTIQLYRCNHCGKTFAPQIVKHKHYPLGLILDAVSLYNLGYNQTEVCQLIKEKYGLQIHPSTFVNWLEELEPLCRYARLRSQAQPLYSPHQVIKSITLNHQQVYQYRYHQAKLDILFRQDKFQDLKSFLTLIEKHCPHDYFRSGSRSSKSGVALDLDKVTIKRKQNHATRLAQLVLQAVAHNRLRHEAVQQFMLANDSVTIAIEVPIFLTPQDIKQLSKELRCQIPFKLSEILTGHIDILQLRNGLVHILDFKPNAKREKPYAQITSYALALSRLTGLKLKDFKCAWFDEHHYYEFFPLHLVYKP